MRTQQKQYIATSEDSMVSYKTTLKCRSKQKPSVEPQRFDKKKIIKFLIHQFYFPFPVQAIVSLTGYLFMQMTVDRKDYTVSPPSKS